MPCNRRLDDLKNEPMKPMPKRKTEGRPDVLAVANAAALSRDTARRADTADVVVMETPYGKAIVHLDRHGADVQLPSGATVHVRFDDR